MIEDLQNILFFSDLHLGGRNDEDRHAARLADALIGSLNPTTSMIVLAGDTIDTPTPDNHAKARRWMRRLEDAGLYVVGTIGNHGCSKGGWQGIDERLRAASVLSLVTCTPGVKGDVLDPPWWVDVGGVRIILADSQWGLRGWGKRPDFARGRLGEDQLAAIATLIDAARAEGRRVVLVLHHRAGYTTHLIDGDNALEDAHALECVLAAHTVDVVVCGHQHPPPSVRLVELDDVAGEALVCPKATKPYEGKLWGWWYEVGAPRATAVGW